MTVKTGDLNVWRDISPVPAQLGLHAFPAQPWRGSKSLTADVRTGPDGPANRITMTGSAAETYAVTLADEPVAGDTFDVTIVAFVGTTVDAGLAYGGLFSTLQGGSSQTVLTQNAAYEEQTFSLVAPETDPPETLVLVLKPASSASFAIMDLSIVYTPAVVPDPDPDPDPEPDPEPGTPTVSISGQKVADFLGAGDDADLVALAGEHVTVITAMVRAYTRDRGFDATTGAPNTGLGAVITSATARLVANPEQLRYGVGSVQYNSAFQGWSLAELAVLNRYRKRAS